MQRLAFNFIKVFLRLDMPELLVEITLTVPTHLRKTSLSTKQLHIFHIQYIHV